MTYALLAIKAMYFRDKEKTALYLHALPDIGVMHIRDKEGQHSICTTCRPHVMNHVTEKRLALCAFSKCTDRMTHGSAL
jgi:hypothetical protein